MASLLKVDTIQNAAGTSGPTLLGTITNDNAATGYVGEAVRSQVAIGSAVTLTTAIFNDVTTISLTAGDWDVSCIVAFTPNTAPTGTQLVAGIGTSSGNSSSGLTLGDSRVDIPTMPTANSDVILTVPAYRVSLSATTTYYLKAYATFSAGGVKAYGRISARRVR